MNKVEKLYNIEVGVGGKYDVIVCGGGRVCSCYCGCQSRVQSVGEKARAKKLVFKVKVQ